MTMTKLCTPFQLFLFLSLFLFYCPPSIQMPSIPSPPIPIHRNIHALKEQLVLYVTVSPRDAKSMKPHGQGRHIGEVKMVAYGVLKSDLAAVPANGVYSVQFGFGTPPTQVHTVLDTGSAVTWIQCQPCQDCYAQSVSDPIFDPTQSTSYKPLECNSQQCQQLERPPKCQGTRQTCPYELSYADGSVTRGDFATENLTFSRDTTVPNIPIGCGHANVNNGHFGTAAGVFGLGRGSLSFISQSQYSAFSYCLSHVGSPKDSHLQFGSSATFSDAVLTIPMLSNTKLPSFYFVGLTGVSVDEQIISVPTIDSSTGFGGAIVDCGTIVTRFPKDVYERLRDAFVKAATGHTVVGSSGPFDTCFGHTSHTEAADSPVVAFHFGEARLTLPPENIMISVGQYTCFGFATTESLYTIIGSHQQQGIRVSFDEDSSTVGFLPGKC